MIKNWSIKKKLTLITMVTSSAAMALSSVGFLTYDLLDYRRTMRQELVTEAQVLGAASAAALTFKDAQGATTMLQALSARPTIVAAGLYDADNVLLASYTSGQPLPALLGPLGPSVDRGRTLIRADWPIELENQRIGTIVIESDDRDFRNRLKSYLLIVLGLMLASASVAFVLSSRLRKLITDPIADLTQAMKSVSTSRDYSLRVSKKYSDEIGGLIDGFNSMIGEIDRAETELHTLNDNLEQRVAERSQAAEERSQALVESEKNLRHAKELAEQASRTKSAFLANMSHELRTPLNAIIGYSEMLEEDFQDLGKTDQVMDIRKVNTAGKHLLTIINDILDLSKIEAGRAQVDAESFNLREIVEQVLTTMEPLILKNSNQISMLVPEQLIMFSDHTKVRQILMNLLSNACKFMSAGTIYLSAEHDTATDMVVVKVRDTGIGIESEQIDRLFEAFVQADASTTRKYGGTGLGLPISRRFCELLGGDLHVESELSVGSVFIMRIPARYEPETISEPDLPTPGTGEVRPAPAVPAASRECVVVIDDDKDSSELLSRLLAKQGLHAIQCNSASEGIVMVKRVRPLAVTLDIQMEHLDGWQTLAILKNDPELCSIPVILVSILQEKSRALKLGAFASLMKPLNTEEFQGVIGKLKAINSSHRVAGEEEDEFSHA